MLKQTQFEVDTQLASQKAERDFALSAQQSEREHGMRSQQADRDHELATVKARREADPNGEVLRPDGGVGATLKELQETTKSVAEASTALTEAVKQLSRPKTVR